MIFRFTHPQRLSVRSYVSLFIIKVCIMFLNKSCLFKTCLQKLSLNLSKFCDWELYFNFDHFNSPSISFITSSSFIYPIAVSLSPSIIIT